MGELLLVSTQIQSRLGLMLAVATAQGICLLEFMDKERANHQISKLEKITGKKLVSGESPFFKPLQQQLDQYFAGTRKDFDLPLDLIGTEFQKKAWNALLTVPFGSTRTYSEQALSIGKPAAVRAVGRANGENRISIIIPCHRLIGKNGNLVGYGGGLERKQFLLDHESRTHSNLFI